MIKVLKKGKYELDATRSGQKVLTLDGDSYAWIYVKGIGDILSISSMSHRAAYKLARGDYRLYEVKDEPAYIDLKHLELTIRSGERQGYLLLTGLPTKRKRRSRIIPTDELLKKGDPVTQKTKL